MGNPLTHTHTPLLHKKPFRLCVYFAKYLAKKKKDDDFNNHIFTATSIIL